VSRSPRLAPLAAAAAALALAGTTVGARAQSGDDYTASRDATVSARGARRVEIEGHAGDLRVTGVEGLTEVRVRGTARASRRAWLDDIRLDARREGDVVVVRADIPDGRDGWNGGYAMRALDLVIEVPRGLDAVVSDGSGDLRVRGVGALELRDGSGSIEVEDVASAVIRDGSGEVRARDVRGDLRVSDGSGSIEAERVRGTVTVERDGSGTVDVRGVGGDLVVQNGRAGRIQYADVRGRVDVPQDRRRARERRW
jgi:hypothetical protein